MNNEADLHTFAGRCGSSQVMQTLFGRIETVARSDATVLIVGESGSGTELVARALHDYSTRTTKPYMALNCSALPAELIESTLFGHVRGAFPGADSDHVGLFQAAHGGTLFLDEIGALPSGTQAKLLRALESGAIFRVGSAAVTCVDVRVVAGTNRPLEEMVAAGTFRDDLLSWLTVVTLAVPPLRERQADILPLVQHFLAPPAKSSFTTDVLSMQFAEARERALHDFDRYYLGAALRRHQGNIARTARSLGIHRQSLQKLMTKRGLKNSRVS